MNGKKVADYLDKLEEFEALQESMKKLSDTFGKDDWRAVLTAPPEHIPYSYHHLGPTPELVHTNNVALLGAIRKLGFEGACLVPEDEVLDDGEEDYDIIIFRDDVNEEHDVGYGRYGYYSDSDDLDQADWDEAITWLLSLK